MNSIDSFYELVDRGRSGQNSSLSIGLPKMEEYTEGYSQGTSYLIGAGSGSGKTTFLLYSFIYKPLMDELNVDKDPHYIYFNLEMTEEQILAKLLTIYIYETYGEIISFKEMFSRGRDTKLSDERYELIKECRPILEKFKSKIIFHSGQITPEVFDKLVAKDMQNFGTIVNGIFIPKNPKQIVGLVVDHMNLLRTGPGQDKKQAIDMVSNHSVAFRNSYKILSPILLMQLNRNSSNQERLKQGLQEPDETDFKETATVYEDAMVAYMLFSPKKAKLATHRGYDIKKLDDNYRSLICLKNRFGTANVAVGIGFYGAIGLFRELPKSEEIRDYETYLSPNWTLKESIKEEDTPKQNFKFKM